MDKLWETIVAELAKAGPILIAIGLLLFAVWWYATGRGRVGTLVDNEKKELREERDDWKKVAQAATPELKRLNDLLETAVNLLLDPRRQPPP